MPTTQTVEDLMSAPIITTATDVLGFFIFLGLAQSVL